MATGAFATQAKQFFNSSIRQALEKALAESPRPDPRPLRPERDRPTRPSLYAVVDQTYVNNKITTPQADVVRMVVDLAKVGRDLEDLRRHRARGRHAGERGLGLGLGRLSVPGQ